MPAAIKTSKTPSVAAADAAAATDNGSSPAPGSQASAAPAMPNTAQLRLGVSVMVRLPPGCALRNMETGGFFEPDVPTPQTVTVTLLRRLQDGDLVLV